MNPKRRAPDEQRTQVSKPIEVNEPFDPRTADDMSRAPYFLEVAKANWERIRPKQAKQPPAETNPPTRKETSA